MGEIEEDGKTFSPLDRRLGENRRPHAERRGGGEPPDTGDQRQLEGRRHAERRVLRYGLLYTMSGSVTVVEEWLEDHCDGGWKMMLEKLDEGLERKTIRVLFELESDKQKFKRMVQRIG